MLFPTAQPVSWTPNPSRSAPRTPNVPWLRGEGEMQPEVPTGLRVTVLLLEKMEVGELEQRQGKK